MSMSVKSVVSNQERVIMARRQYVLRDINGRTNKWLRNKIKSRISERKELPELHKISV